MEQWSRGRSHQPDEVVETADVRASRDRAAKAAVPADATLSGRAASCGDGLHRSSEIAGEPRQGTAALTHPGPTHGTSRVIGPLPPRGQGATILTSASQLLTPPLRPADSVSPPVEDQDVRPV